MEWPKKIIAEVDAVFGTPITWWPYEPGRVLMGNEAVYSLEMPMPKPRKKKGRKR